MGSRRDRGKRSPAAHRARARGHDAGRLRASERRHRGAPLSLSRDGQVSRSQRAGQAWSAHARTCRGDRFGDGPDYLGGIEAGGAELPTTTSVYPVRGIFVTPHTSGGLCCSVRLLIVAEMERVTSKIGTISLAVALIGALALAASSRAATSVGLGTANSFAILAGAGVTNTGPSVINGDLGTSPTPAVTGFGGGPNGTVNGATHQADALAAQAQADLTTAYNNAAGQGPVNTLATELGGQTLTPGVYNSESGTFGITGTLTLNGQGNPDAVFIFKTATTLISASESQVLMINGAQPCHLFWQVGSSATLGTDSAFAGNILALESIELNSGVTVLGRLLARNASVTLINDTVTRADCAVAGPGPGGGETGPGGGGGGDAGTGGGGGESGTGGAGGGRGNRGGGNGAGPSGTGPNARIVGGAGGPRGGRGPGPPRVERGFRARFRVDSSVRMRSVSVFLDGKVIKQSTRKQFSVWVRVVGLRAGRSTLRIVAVDRRGRRDVASRSFRRCARAAPSPDFTG